MNLCNDNHEEICFSGRNCPVCEAIKDRNSLNDELTAVQNSLNETQANLDDALAMVRRLEEPVIHALEEANSNPQP